MKKLLLQINKLCLKEQYDLNTLHNDPFVADFFKCLPKSVAFVLVIMRIVIVYQTPLDCRSQRSVLSAVIRENISSQGKK